MAYGIMRVSKAKASDLGGLEAEANRDKEHKKDFPGSSIDWDRTGNNEFILKTNGWKRATENIINEKGCRKRKDSTYMIDSLFTASPDFFENLPPETEKAFFKECFDFAARHFGIVMNGVIHKDERTPHLHVATVPIVEKEGGKYSLSAKILLGGKEDMHKLQDMVYEEVFKKFGLNRGEVQDPVTRREHLDTLDYKLKTREEEVKTAEIEKAEIEKDIGKLERIREIISSVKVIAEDLFTRVFRAIREGFHNLCDKIERNQGIKPEDLVSADCKMKKCASCVLDNGDKLPMYAPRTNAGEPLTWAGNRPVYGLENGEFIGLYSADGENNFTRIDSPEWEDVFSREKQDFDDSFCDRDICALEEKIDLIDRIINEEDEDPIDNNSEDREPPEEIGFDDAEDILDDIEEKPREDDDDIDPVDI